MPMTMKQKLADPDCRLSGQLCVIPSAVSAQALAAAGADYLILDLEHAATSFETLHAMITATQGTECAPLVRVPSIDGSEVKRALDLGAEGICFPLIRSPEDVQRAVAALRYRPEGVRSWGPFVAHSRWGVEVHEYLPGPGAQTVCMILIETAEALERIDEVLAVPGIDCAILAPFDLSTELGVPGDLAHPKMTAARDRIEAAARTAGIPLGGGVFTEEQAAGLAARGYRLAVGFDILSLKARAKAEAQWFKGAA